MECSVQVDLLLSVFLCNSPHGLVLYNSLPSFMNSSHQSISPHTVLSARPHCAKCFAVGCIRICLEEAHRFIVLKLKTH